MNHLLGFLLHVKVVLLDIIVLHRLSFEATVLGKVNDLLLSGSVSRLDGYGQLQQCVKDHYLEKLCHCLQEDVD